MSLTDAQIQFAADFLTLVVSAALLAVALLRPPSRARRPVATLLRVIAAAGLLTVGAMAFLHGSLLVTGHSVKALGAARLAGAAVLLPVLPAWWAGRRLGSTSVALALLAWVAAGVVELAASPARVTPGFYVDGLLTGGAVVLAVALITLSRDSIAIRVAASGATTLFVVVLVLSLALAAAISSSVQKSEVNRLTDRTQVELGQLYVAGSDAGRAVAFVGADLNEFFQPQPGRTDAIQAAVDGVPSDEAAADTAIASRIQNLLDVSFAQSPELGINGSIAYLDPTGHVIYPPASQVKKDRGLTPTVAQVLASEAAMKVSCAAGKGGHGVFVVSGQVWVAASYPECSSGTYDGTVVTALPLGTDYLTIRATTNSSMPITVALVYGSRVTASRGMPLPPEAATFARRSEGAAGHAFTSVLNDNFVSSAALQVPSGQPRISLVLSAPATAVLTSRTNLYRTLFLVALGGTVLALGLAIFTGDRITFRLRRLTTTASRIQAGNTGVRAGISGSDEVAVLGSAFDAMIDSVAAQESALRAAADDETRLRNRIQAVVAGMTDALVAVDAEGRITDFNRAATELTGVSVDNALGRPVERIVRIVSDDGRQLDHRELDPSRTPWAALGDLRQRDGTRVPVAASAGALKGPAEELVGSVLVIRDLRREHEVEQMKTEFLSRIGHELRTPLAGIMGYAEILMRKEVTPDRARLWHDEILRSARRLLRIVEMLEFFASSGAGRITYRHEPLDLGAIINGVTSSWAVRVPDGFEIRRRVARGIPTVEGDRRWITMAVDELIDNAVKFSPDGGRILVSARPGRPSPNGSARRRETVEISVQDRGMGLTRDQLDVIFTDFAQADGSDTRRFGGLGLGLAVARRVVEGHGGSISCESVGGRGATFTIRLPVGKRRVDEGNGAG